MPVVLMVATPLSVFRNGGPRPSMEGAAGRLRRPEGRGHMDKHSLSHTSWECVYHVVWIPKYRRKVLYGEMRREIGQILRALAERFILIAAAMMPVQSFTNACYFTMRSGGKTFVTFLFDSVFLWVVSIPLAFVLSRFTALPIVPLYFVCQAVDIIKCVIGFVMVRRGVWIHNFVTAEK